MNYIVNRITGLFTFQTRSCSQFVSDYACRVYHAQEHSRVTCNIILTVVPLAVLLGMLLMWLDFQGGAL